VVRIFVELLRFSFDCAPYFCYRSLYIIKRTIAINVKWSPCKIPVSFFRTVIELEFSRQLLEKYSDTKFNENPSSGSRLLYMRMDGQTDKHCEASSRFSQFLRRRLKTSVIDYGCSKMLLGTSIDTVGIMSCIFLCICERF